MSVRAEKKTEPASRARSMPVDGADLIFILFFGVYMTIATSYSLPDVARWIVGAIMLCYSLAAKLVEQDPFRLLPGPFIWLMAAFTLGLIPLTIGLSYPLQRILSFFLVVASLFLFLDRRKMTRAEIARYFTIFSWMMMAVAAIQVVNWLMKGLPIGSFRGTYGNQNTLNAVMLLACGCALWLVARYPRIKPVTIPMAALSMLIVVADGSRVGLVCLVGLVAAVPFIFIRGKSLHNQMKILISILLLLVAGTFIVVYVDIPALDRLFGAEDAYGSTGLSRGFVWNEAWRIVEERPWFGWGFGAAGYYTFVNNPTQYLFGVHSSYFTILIENGIFGCLLYAGFAISMAWKLWRMFRGQALDELSVRFCKITAVMALLFLLNCATESFLFSMGSPPAVFFWFTLVCLYRYLESGRQEPESGPLLSRGRSWRV